MPKKDTFSAFQQFPVWREPISPQNNGDLHKQLLSLHKNWTSAHRIDTFFTLGKATYLWGWKYADLPQIAENNALLGAHFSLLYQSIHHALTRHLEQEPVWDNRVWRPGFHFFPVSELHRSKVSFVHADVTHEMMDWPALGVHGEHEGTLTFTLPIHSPAAKPIGIRLWLRSVDEHRALEQAGHPLPTSNYEFVKSSPQQDFFYQQDELFIHHGSLFHEILPFSGEAGDFRITLQGHAVKKNGAWYVYW